MRKLSLFIIATLFVALLTAPLRAAFILDDFDDPAEVVSPEMENDFMETAGVGSLAAVRSIRIAVAGADPNAQLSIGLDQASIMSAAIFDLNRTDTLTPLFAFQFNYDFEPIDISEDGLNDAILFDFRSISGSESPTFLRVIAKDNTNPASSFEARVHNLPTDAGIFTAIMPFSSFTLRGGGPGMPDFTTFKQLDFDFFFLGPGSDIQWAAELERIRFGRIPEPGTLWAVAALTIIAGRIVRTGDR